MKKLLLSGILLFSAAGIASAQRMMLLEHFTQASCGPCASQNPALKARLDANPGKVVAIKYQTSWPGVDPMNAANPTDAANRVTYYNVTGVPNSVVDGNAYNGSPGGVNQSLIDTRSSGSDAADVDVKYIIIDNADPVSDSMLVTAKVKAISALPAGYKLRVAAIERQIEFATPPGSNGEKYFESVMKKMLPDGNGTTLPAIAAGDSVSYTFKWSLKRANGSDVYYNLGQAAAVGFVQNDANKQVLGTAYDAPRPWLAIARAEGQKPVRIKSGNDISFDFNAVSKTNIDQDINVVATVTNLPAGWTASIVADGNTYPSPATVVLPANSEKLISVKISGPNDAALNRKVSVKVETNSLNLFPGVKNSLNFTAVTPSNILFMDLAGTASSRFTQAFTAASQANVALNAEESAGLDAEGLTAASVKKIFYSTGAAFSGTLNAENSAVFASYLESGGNLFIMGQDIGYEVFSAAGAPEAQDFYSNYLGAEYISDGTNAAYTVTKVADDLIMSPALPTAALSVATSTTSYPDQLSVSGNGVAFLNYSTGNVAGIHNSTDVWKAIYIGFRMESIGASGAPVTFRNALIARANGWFDNLLTSNELQQSVAASLPAYPNPATQKLYVPVASGKGSIQLSSLTGQVVREMEVTTGSSSVATLDIAGLTPGIYFLKTKGNAAQGEVQKIVIE
jgi:hypothetical protein